MQDDRLLERSAVVANSAMNRQRGCAGTNSYAKELRFNPVEFLARRVQSQADVAWLDLCCGSGRALIEAGRELSCLTDADHANLELIGVDLVPMFEPRPRELSFVRLVTASAARWAPTAAFDLITCVHGLHYLGDKLELIRSAASWLKRDGLFVAHLDTANLRLSDEDGGGRTIVRDLRRQGVEYDTRTHLLRCVGKKALQVGYEYVGADDRAGPNYTGQEAVNSYYRRRELH